MKITLIGFAIALILIAGTFILLIFSFQEKIIFQAEGLPVDYKYKFPWPFEEVNFNNGEARINGLHFTQENPKGVVLYLHGNSGTLRDWGFVYEQFKPHQYDMMIIDYRNYGKSIGKFDEAAMHQDVATIFSKLKEQYSEEQIVVYGRSLGSGFATKLASEHNVRCLILETPFHSLDDLAKRMFGILPASILLKYHLNNAEYIQDVSAPIYLIHGTKDRVVPIESFHKLCDHVNGNSQVYIVEGGDHNSIPSSDEFSEMLNNALE